MFKLEVDYIEQSEDDDDDVKLYGVCTLVIKLVKKDNRLGCPVYFDIK